ncbi:hypothetical protein CORC01_11976 [Colletotrichum orchidophilum]|uniref:C2H2-type domain-containing protein n=1 Tax=Colletotrichum orchidophilum TaxID=1209926 RepID=A0A1G4AUC5_9PEZI|nr:uncharacterized protein CORC01_11976 [Colletotrichum orchidophilum]OHE92758.1 hypothetical protein CORC01_11976 [Colletotrichum orchidophilum]
MSPEDVRTLCDLAGRYGSGSLETTLRNISGSNYTSLRPPPPPQQHHRNPHHMDAPARNSALSTSTFGSNNSAPSLTTSAGPWSSSDASFCGSDAASLSGSYFNQQPGADASWADAVDAPFLMSPSVTPSLSGSEWQDHHIGEHHLSSTPSHEKKAAAASLKSPSSGAVVGRKPIECPMCAVHDVYVGFGRKSDFKKHLQNFHNTDCIWVCPQENCRMIFDFEKAYVAHVKLDHNHGEACPPAAAAAAAEQVRVSLCAQVVFACGFIGCKEVLEASDDSEAPKTADAYFDHLASHFDKRSGSGSNSNSNSNSNKNNSRVASEWTYYHQMQNLLRQRSLKDEWKHTLWDKAARNQLRWQPRSSGDLKKLLECRHLADVPRILHAAWTLGQTCFSSPEHPAPEFPGEATRPVRARCPLAGQGRNHGELRDVVSGRHQQQNDGSASTTTTTTTSSMTMFALRRGLFPVNKLATVSHPPPRSIPEEPDSLAYPHPGTPLVIPERDAWSTDVVLGPPEDEQLYDPVFMPGGGGGGGGGATTNMMQNPIYPWIDATQQHEQQQQQRRSFGDFARHLTPSPQPTEDQESSLGPLLRVPRPTAAAAAASKRPRSWGMRSLENLRLKRRGRSSPGTSPVEEKAPLPGWI